MKIPATPAHHALRLKLSGLTASSIKAESLNAKDKLRKLEAKYDFSAAPEEADIFASLTPQITRDAHRVVALARGEDELAAFLRDMLAHGWDLQAQLRTVDWHPEVWALCTNAGTVAASVAAAFRTLWRTFAAAPGVDPAHRRVFWRGLYDGMLDDPRQPGERLPSAAGSRSYVASASSRRTRRALAFAPGVALHPYSTAFELGRHIRCERPLAEISDGLNQQIAAAKAVAQLKDAA